jgi:hypothetical protein
MPQAVEKTPRCFPCASQSRFLGSRAIGCSAKSLISMVGAQGSNRGPADIASCALPEIIPNFMDIFCISPEVSVSWPTHGQHRACFGAYLVLETLNTAATSTKTRTTPRKRIRFGRPNILRRLPGLDLRSAEGKHYSVIYAEVAAEFGAEKRNISRLR